ncbi:hypothetical protein [Hyalangium rubrum]|uniref:Lipoprotein n=1 Tax=Hyalangium rubrum TaxID=3103134 RepID=A0ABU5HCF3_9BACT|nr:hypothetical protein [Hyalangium sp. s54d21]MDY7231143.1 hypothetical protein [Hyalangium sp. s54d21]
MRRFLRPGLVALCASFVLVGCPDKQPAGQADSGVAEAPQDVPPAAPPPASFTVRYQLTDAGTDLIPLTAEERPTIEPTSSLELHSSIGLRNYRIRLFDEAERAMISDDSAEETPEAVIYRIALPNPLKSGHKYTLVVDPQTGTSFTDTLGREVQELRLEFQVAGEKEKDKPAPAPKNEKKKRR